MPSFSISWCFPLWISRILLLFLLWYFLSTQFYSSRTPLEPEPRSGGSEPANHNTDPVEALKSLFHGSSQIKTYSRASVSAGVKVWKTCQVAYQIETTLAEGCAFCRRLNPTYRCLHWNENHMAVWRRCSSPNCSFKVDFKSSIDTDEYQSTAFEDLHWESCRPTSRRYRPCLVWWRVISLWRFLWLNATNISSSALQNVCNMKYDWTLRRCNCKTIEISLSDTCFTLDVLIVLLYLEVGVGHLSVFLIFLDKMNNVPSL